MKIIDYPAIIANIDVMINTLEFDAMRSPGRMKQSSNDLFQLLSLKKHYENKVKMADMRANKDKKKIEE